MAEVSTVVQQPPEFIEAAAKPYITQLQQVTGGLKEADLSKVYGPQFTAGLGALTQQAIGKVGGLGAYEPYLQAAQAATGPTAYQAYMSPYQQDIIDTTLADYDIQAQKGLPQLAAQAINAGAYGGGREGVQRAEYQSASDRNRAALQAQLLQQGFGQAQGLAAQQFNQQMNLAQQAPAFAGQQISALTTLGGLQQSQAQAELAAQQQLAQQQLMQPLQATQALGSGITGLIAGYPGSTQTQTQPSPTPLQTALGAGATLAGVYRAFN
jgi:hypothetical protein